MTPATGGSNVPVDSFVTLSGPSITETSPGQIGVGTIVLQAPQGFQFDTTSSITASVSSVSGLCLPLLNTVLLNGSLSQTVTPTPNQITVNVTRSSSLTCTSRITWSGIRVKATSAGATGNITKASGGSSISGVTDGVTNFGTLSAQAPYVTLTLGTSSVPFGSGLSPDGSPSSQADVGVYTFPGGTYYVKSSSGYAETVKVSSNAPWSGSVSAAENTGTSGMKIASGSLRWALGDITSLAQAQGATPFSTTPDTSVFNTASSCSSGATLQAGSCTYNFDYALRVLWTNAPGTFSSVVTYTVMTR